MPRMYIVIRSSTNGVLLLLSLKKQRELIQGPCLMFLNKMSPHKW